MTLTGDGQLLERIAAGDAEALAALYGRHQGGVYRFALHMSGSAAVAEDMTQEAFLALIRDASRYDAARGSPAGYLYGIARKLVLRWLERERRPAPADEEAVADDPADELARRQDIQAVRQAVLSLPEHYREVVVLCELEEMDYAQAAAALGCAVGTVRSRLHRARALLSEKLRGRAEVNGVRCQT